MKYRLVSEENNKRIDKYLAENTEFSRSVIKSLIEDDHVLVNDKAIKSSYKVEIGDVIVFNYIEEKLELIPKEIEFDIYYEDDDILVINKDKDRIVHPASNDQQDTIVNGLLFKYKTLGNMDSTRPGIVHRLDKDTTGLLLIAKNDNAYENLVNDFSNRDVKRKYLALLHGQIDKPIKIDEPIGRNEKDRIKFGINYKNGKKAITQINPIEIYSKYTLAEVELFTGRTHQIRVHAESINHPLVGDLFYGYENEFKIKTQMLHCYYLKFNHPITKTQMEIKTEIPEYFQEVIKNLKWK